MSNGSAGITIVAMMMISLPVPFCLQKLRVITVHTQQYTRKQKEVFLLARDSQLLVNG